MARISRPQERRRALARLSDLDRIKGWLANQVQRSVFPGPRRPPNIQRPADAVEVTIEIVSALTTLVHVRTPYGTRTFRVKVQEVTDRE